MSLARTGWIGTPGPLVVCGLGTPELIYSHTGFDRIVVDVVDSGAGTLLLCFVNILTTPSSGLIQEHALTGGSLGTYLTSTREVSSVAVDASGDNYILHRGSGEMLRNGSAFTSGLGFSSSSWKIAFDPDDGSLWFAKNQTGQQHVLTQVDSTGATVSTFGATATAQLGGMVWVVDRFYIVDFNSSVHLYRSYEPGVGFAVSPNFSIGSDNNSDVTYSPAMGRLLLVSEAAGVWSHPPGSSDASEAVIEVPFSDFTGMTTVNGIEVVDDFVYVTGGDGADSMLWRIPIEC